MMDSKNVNREIKSTVWASLKTRGFDNFSTRTAWRHHADRIDVVNFQLFNSYNASAIGCTTFSFAINLGCYLPYIPDQYGPGHVNRRTTSYFPKNRNVIAQANKARAEKVYS